MLPNAAPHHPTDAVAELLADVRARGIELRADGERLLVRGQRSAYSAALRARLLAHKHEIVDYLRDEQVRAEATYEAERQAWGSRYVENVARAWGYDDTIARGAAALAAKLPREATFRVGGRAITIVVAPGFELRIHQRPTAVGLDRQDESDIARRPAQTPLYPKEGVA